MREIQIYIIITLLFSPIFLFAQYSTITGKITDEKAQPLPYVTLQLTTPDSVFIQGTTTEEQGNYKLTEVGPGDYLLFLSSVGYGQKVYPFRQENKDRALPDIILKSSSVALQEVEVKAQSIVQLDDRMLVFPEKQQVRHSYTGYDLLDRLMIPGLDVDRRGGSVKNFAGTVTLYIDGRKADFREVQSLRPRDVEKVEYFEAPTGKYAMDVASINYITKKYTSGGYVSLDARQTIGYLQGDYNASMKINKGNTAFTVWGGHNMTRYGGSHTVSDETYTFPDQSITKHSETTDGLQRSNRQYAQAKVNNRTDRRTMEAKLGFARNANPGSWQTSQTVYDEHDDGNLTRSEQSQLGISPKMQLYGNFKIQDNQSLETSLGGLYSNTLYERNYDEGNFHSYTHVDEDYYQFSANLNYALQMKRQQSLAVHLTYAHSINSANYTGDYDQSTKYWFGHANLLAEYAIKWKKLSISLNAGLASELYQLRDRDLTRSLLPLGNIRLSYRLTNKQMLTFYTSVRSVPPFFTWLNPIEQKVDSFMVKRGNPDQRWLIMNNNRLNYSLQAGKFNINALVAFHYNSNLPLSYYFVENDKIVNSYSNDIKGKEVDALLSVTWKAIPNLQIKAEGSYTYLSTKGLISFRHNIWEGVLQINYYWKSLGINAFIKTPVHSMDLSAAHTQDALNYGLSVNWSYRNWWIEAGVNAPFTKDRYKRFFFNLSPVYSYDKTIHDRTYQQTGWVKVAYNFDFGRKTAKDKDRVNTNIQSTILKVE